MACVGLPLYWRGDDGVAHAVELDADATVADLKREIEATGGPLAAIRLWPTIVDVINPQAVAIAGLSLLVMIFWPGKWQRVLPPPLAALLIGTVAALLIFRDVPVISDVPTGLPELFIPAFGLGDIPRLAQPALILALLGSIDSLLTSLVADSITRTRHNSNQELIGQGIGNMVAGLIGGLPGAGATMRTVVNVRAGGRTRISGALHAVVLLALVLGLAPLAERIPHAVLAGILLKVGWDIIDWGHLKRIRRAPRDKTLVMLVTLTLTVFVDLITAVAVGLILAGFVTARWMEKQELNGVTSVALPDADTAGLSEAELALLAQTNGRIGIARLRGHFSYASARELVARAGAQAAFPRTRWRGAWQSVPCGLRRVGFASHGMPHAYYDVREGSSDLFGASRPGRDAPA